nr:hypothetical protein [Tanacetum cinerariifolium]GEY53302.1 hypothetical protein [Tanacetum cinerariifolium]
MLEVMQNNHISLFTKSASTSVDDLSHMELKLKLLNRTHKNKNHPTNQKIYDTLYDSILLDQDVLDAQEAKPSFHKWTHNHQDPPTNRWFTKKSGLANVMRRTTWFGLLLKSNIDQNEDHILGPSTVAITKKLKEIIQKDELTIADLQAAGLEKLKLHYKNDVELEYHVDQLKAVVVSKSQWNNDEEDVSKPRSFKCHMSKIFKPHPSFYNNDFDYLVDLSTKERYNTFLTKHYAVRYHIQDSRNLVEMITKNMLGRGNERLKGRDWNDKEIKKSKEMVNNIDQVMKHREQLRLLEEYVGGHPKTINPMF